MTHYVVKLPDIGEGIAESEIAQWHVAVGDTLHEDQAMVDMLTDKAAVELPAPLSGRVLALHGAVGDKIAVGAPLLTLEIDAEAASVAAPGPGPSRAEAQPTPVPAAPSVRKLARELGIELREVKGSGPAGRVLREDLERHQAASTPPPSLDDEAVETVRVIGLRRKTAEVMQRTKQRIPHYSYVEEIDVTELEGLRQRLNERYRERARLSLLPLLIQALVRAVAQFPVINARYDDEQQLLMRYRALHVGIATQTPGALLVPVLRHAQRLSLWQRAEEIRRLAQAARAGKARREELSGSTITITSLGPLGGIVTTPVINAPEVAIIGVNRIVERPVVRKGQIVVRSMMNLSSSFDHRIVDGFDAASFIQQVRALLEDPALLFIEP